MGANEDMIKERLKTVFLSLSCIFMIFIIGCGDKNPPSEEQVLSYIEESYGDSYKLISTEVKQDTEDESDLTVYHFQSEFGFDFDVIGGVAYTPPGKFPGYYSKYYNTDYMDKLHELIAVDIKNLIDKYSSEQIQITTEDADHSIDVTFETYSNIDSINKFIYELISLYQDKYKVKKEGLYHINIDIYKDDKVFYWLYLSWLIEVDEEKNLKELQLKYVEEIRQGEFIDSTVDEDMLTNMPRTVINNLIINGDQYTSDKYEPEFAYSVDEQEWLAIVGYGIILEYNGGVQDYMQREIIVKYLDGDYDIDDKNRITRYTIGNDSYEIYFPYDSGDGIKGGYYFKKNNEKLNIKLCEIPRLWGGTGAVYYAYIKLSDWAKLLNMEYIVDNKEGVVILNSK